MANDMPTSPLSDLTATAVQMHEWFRSLIDAGFTEAQAIALIAAVLKPSPS